MEHALASLNKMQSVEAAACLFRCCGSHLWVDQMVDARPFSTVEHLQRTARDLWWALGETDWLEAFSSHPEIGGRDIGLLPPDRAQWAVQEQKGTANIAAAIKRRLFDANVTYRARFGFIFIICATGMNGEEMLHSLESRLENDRATELRIAAEQQTLITEIRLDKLLIELKQNGR